MLPVQSCRRANGANSTARSTARPSPLFIPFYTASASANSKRRAATIVGSAPVGHDGTAAWLEAIGKACNVGAEKIDAAKARILPMIGARSPRCRSTAASRFRVTRARNCSSRVCWSKAARDVHYVGTACPRTRWSERRSRMAASQRRPCHVSRLARAGPCGAGRVQAGPRDRHHAGRAESQRDGDPGALFHQSDLGAPADGAGRRRVAGAGHQCRDGRQEPLRRR